MTAKDFINDMYSFDQTYGGNIPKIEIFSLGKRYISMTVPEIIKLLKNDNHDIRVGAVAILDWKARDKKTTPTVKKELYEAYLDNHKWIDDWGLVDRAAPYVIGGYLFDKDRSPLYKLATSNNPMERRTAIVATYYFIRKNQIEDTFRLAEILVNDRNEYVQKAVGSWIREAGKRDERRLKAFLDTYAATMPRITLRYAVEKLSSTDKLKYLKKFKQSD